MKSALHHIAIVVIGVSSLGLASCANTSSTNLTSSAHSGKGQGLGSENDNSSSMLLTKHEYMEAPPPGRLNGGF